MSRARYMLALLMSFVCYLIGKLQRVNKKGMGIAVR